MHEKKHTPPIAGSRIQSSVRVLNFIILGREFIFKKSKRIIGSPIYSIPREVIDEFESLKVSSLTFALCFHKKLVFLA